MKQSERLLEMHRKLISKLCETAYILQQPNPPLSAAIDFEQQQASASVVWRLFLASEKQERILDLRNKLDNAIMNTNYNLEDMRRCAAQLAKAQAAEQAIANELAELTA